MINTPRIAFFADTFHEVNGAANVCRRLADYARDHNYPFLSIRAGEETRAFEDGSLEVLELKRSKLSVPIDGELKYDPRFWRYKKLIEEKLKEFKPDVIHVTGLNDISQLGFYFAHYRSLPGVSSWHTNVHEYAARRLVSILSRFPSTFQRRIGEKVEATVWRGVMKLNQVVQIQLAPNEELVQQIQKMTRRPSFLMSRGVDVNFLHPDKRTRPLNEKELILGYVGRLRPEKNVRFFQDIDQALQKAGLTNYKFVLVGEGTESEWLKENLSNAELPGVLRGEALAEAFANMDLFVFPSKTDAFGNVVLEGMAAGVPGVVFPDNGPKFLIKKGVDGFIVEDEADFIKTIVETVKEPKRLKKMRKAARVAACERSWDRVFESVYDKYFLATKIDRKVRV